jgi:hypothetical protein
MTGGVQMALGVGALIALGVLVLAYRQPTPSAEAGAHGSEDVAEIDSGAGPDVAEFEQEFSDHELETCGCAAGGGSECARS